MYKELLDKINEFDKITIFRHARPDGDCMFSSLALYYFLKDNYKNKNVKLCGFEKYDIESKIEKVSNKFISDSLAIVLDTATIERIDDNRIINSKYIIKIDHHPVVQNYGNINIVKPNYSSTCELLAEILLSNLFNKYSRSENVYRYLYSGIITDTLNFRTSNVSDKTLLIASKLVKYGNLKPSNIVEYLTDVDLQTYSKITLLRNKLNVNNKFGYIKLNKKDLSKIGFEPIEAKNHIDEIGCIKDLNVWAFAVENNGGWDCSIRSKRAYIVNKIAEKYNGGGHANACAVKHLNASELNKMFKELLEISKKY